LDWRGLIRMFHDLGARRPVDPGVAAVTRWERAYAFFNEVDGTLPAGAANANATVRSVDCAIAEIWAAERQMALHFGGAESSVPVIWPWMRPADELAAQRSLRAASAAEAELPAGRVAG
jgi:hypothetical protein